MLHLWCDGCRTIVHAAVAHRRPADDRFPWLAWTPAAEPLWLCPGCQAKHSDLGPYFGQGRPAVP